MFYIIYGLIRSGYTCIGTSGRFPQQLLNSSWRQIGLAFWLFGAYIFTYGCGLYFIGAVVILCLILTLCVCCGGGGGTVDINCRWLFLCLILCLLLLLLLLLLRLFGLQDTFIQWRQTCFGAWSLLFWNLKRIIKIKSYTFYYYCYRHFFVHTP